MACEALGAEKFVQRLEEEWIVHRDNEFDVGKVT